MVWFGEAELPQHGSRLVMRPPTAQSTSVSPGLIKGAVESKLWVSARLGKDGRLTSVSVAQGASAPRAVDLATEMENWRFTPAIRNGEAVEVDLLLEANFVRQSGSDDRN
jgi:hypothetical protein